MEIRSQDWRDLHLDGDEIDLLQSIENKEWRSMGNIELRKQQLRTYFIDNNETESIINLKINKDDLDKLIIKSQQYGLNYNEIIEKLIHNFTVDKIVI